MTSKKIRFLNPIRVGVNPYKYSDPNLKVNKLFDFTQSVIGKRLLINQITRSKIQLASWVAANLEFVRYSYVRV